MVGQSAITNTAGPVVHCTCTACVNMAGAAGIAECDYVHLGIHVLTTWYLNVNVFFDQISETAAAAALYGKLPQ